MKRKGRKQTALGTSGLEEHHNGDFLPPVYPRWCAAIASNLEPTGTDKKLQEKPVPTS